ncbi:hypothetical protein DFH06DRAFT_1200453 [Mycena polygramma]|nr:hypothetical protein DFH06DRAFT_1200453 [Mycena polygramma]
MILIDLPTDILLEVVKFLELPDPLSLLLTCSSVYTLSNQRSFWISILETTRAKSPIGCPQHADLSLYGLEALKVLAVSWLKLQDNWNQASPQIRGPAIWYPRFVEPTQIVFNVQGTEIIVVNNGTVYCWDAKSMQGLPFPAIEVGRNRSCIGSVSAPIEAPGVWTLAFLAEWFDTPVTNIYIITIKHDGGKVISFTNECHQLLVSQGTYFDPVFLTEDVVGTVVAGNNQDQCIISVGALSALRSPLPSTIVLKLHRPVSDHDLVVSSVYKGHLYILLDERTAVHIYHISRESLRSGRCERVHLHKSEIDSSYDNIRIFCFMVPSTPFYGVTAIYLRLESSDDASTVTSFTFLPNTLTYAADPDVSSPLAFDAVCVTEYVLGTPLDVSLVWMDHSGFNVLAVLEVEPESFAGEAIVEGDFARFDWPDGVPKLVLVRYHPETRRTSQHTLVVPDTINLKNLDAVCIDDTTGAVHLLDKQGLFTTFRYV